MKCDTRFLLYIQLTSTDTLILYYSTLYTLSDTAEV